MHKASFPNIDAGMGRCSTFWPKQHQVAAACVGDRHRLPHMVEFAHCARRGDAGGAAIDIGNQPAAIKALLRVIAGSNIRGIYQTYGMNG